MTGTQINGISQGASYGDDAEMDTNYPIVRLLDSGGQVFYARTFNWSSTGVATGASPVSTSFMLPPGLQPGTYSLSVVANGIASTPVTFDPSQEVRINTQTAGPQGHPYPDFPQGARIARNASGAFVVVYQSNMNSAENGQFFAKLYDAAGNVVRDEFPIAPGSNQRYASAAMADDGHFVIAWDNLDDPASSFNVYFQRFDAKGNPVGGVVRANTVQAGSQARAEVGMDGAGNIVVSWNGNGPGDPDGVFVRRFNADGSARDPQEILVNSTFRVDYRELGQTLMVDRAGDFAVAFVRKFTDGTPYQSLRMVRFNANGTPAGGEIRIADIDPMIDTTWYNWGAMDGAGNILVAWEDGGTNDADGIYAARFDTTGKQIGSNFAVNTTTAGRQMSPTVGLDSGGDAVIAWTSVGQDGDGPGVYAQRFDPSANRVGGEFRVNSTTTGAQNTPTLALDQRGNFVITWTGNGVGDDQGIFARWFPKAPTAGLAATGSGTSAIASPSIPLISAYGRSATSAAAVQLMAPGMGMADGTVAFSNDSEVDGASSGAANPNILPDVNVPGRKGQPAANIGTAHNRGRLWRWSGE